MTAQILKYQRGDVLVFTKGEYSDYDMIGFLVAVEELDLPALAKKFGGTIEDFPSWLVIKGLALPCEHSLVHLGSYGCWLEEFGVPV